MAPIRVALAMALSALVSAGLLHERFQWSLSASAALRQTDSAGTSCVVDVAELPPRAGSTGSALEIVLSDMHFIHAVDGGKMRAKLPPDVQLAYARPFFVLLGEHGGLQEVREGLRHLRRMRSGTSGDTSTGASHWGLWERAHKALRPM